ncbi:MAG: nucleoside-diphosphate kinase [Pseudomonadota bacterium]|nr:nucleoside-diphosphate kinase [Pseudomonadota bacterium]
MVTTTRTLSIVKPDAVRRSLIGNIFNRFEQAGLNIIATNMIHMTQEQAKQFYIIHKDRPFYNELVTFMSSGPVVVSVLEGPNAVKMNRDLMGATNPSEAQAGTIRHDLSESIGENSVHGSDSDENAATEIRFFFPDLA